MNTMAIFKMPKAVSITGRSSTITNSFVNSIIPCVSPTEKQLGECLKILGLDPEDLRCAYCGDKSTEWDHLRPIVENKKPTGYITDIYNLVPSCGKCNQSKGNKYWKDWINSNAKCSPKSRGKTDVNQRIGRLEKYEKWKSVTRINLKNIVGKELWSQHWANCGRLHDVMKEAQVLADQVKERIQAHMDLEDSH